MHQLAAITGWTSVRFLRTLSQPTLILAGDVPLINARILGALIPNARVNVYSGGHVELVADPHRLVLAIEDFLTSDDAATDVSGRAAASDGHGHRRTSAAAVVPVVWADAGQTTGAVCRSLPADIREAISAPLS